MSRNGLRSEAMPEQESSESLEWLVSRRRTDTANLGRLALAVSAAGVVVGALAELAFPGAGDPIAAVSAGGVVVGGSILAIDKITQ